jgi:protein ImuA
MISARRLSRPTPSRISGFSRIGHSLEEIRLDKIRYKCTLSLAVSNAMHDKNLPPIRQQIVAQLQESLERFSRARRGVATPVSTGCTELDRHLPQGGLTRGTLVEWLSPGAGSGAGSLALSAAREACRDGGPLVVIDRTKSFYPLAAVQAGMELARLIVVRPESAADEQWALDQSLRSPGVAAVLCWLEKCPARVGRRLQLAAEAGGNLGLMIRPATTRGDPCWAEVRFLVTPLVSAAERQLRVELLRLRGNAGGRTFDLELNDETGTVCLAPAVAAATVVRHAAGG